MNRGLFQAFQKVLIRYVLDIGKYKAWYTWYVFVRSTQRDEQKKTEELAVRISVLTLHS